MKTMKDAFPSLTKENHSEESERSTAYNCIAWAFEDKKRFWWPDESDDCYWPDGVPIEETQDAFIALAQEFGYEAFDSPDIESGYEKLALYCRNHLPTHMARQQTNGKWTSKLGSYIDIEHTLDAIEGPCYGEVVTIFRRSVERKKKKPSRE